MIKNGKEILGIMAVIIVGTLALVTNKIPVNVLRGLTGLLLILAWMICCRNIYRGFKDKRYTTYLSIAICEIAIVGIISTFAIKVIVLGGVIGGESIWIVLIIGILSIVHKRLRSPINLNQRRKYRNPRGKYST